jgi:hypothetical protein
MAFSGGAHKFVELGTRVLGTRLANINVFPDEFKPSRAAISSQVAELNFATLVFRADTCPARRLIRTLPKNGGRCVYVTCYLATLAMLERCAKNARRVIFLKSEEAIGHRSPYIESEHLLLVR